LRKGSIVLCDTRVDLKGFQANADFFWGRALEVVYLARPGACYDPPRVLSSSKERVEGG